MGDGLIQSAFPDTSLPFTAEWNAEKIRSRNVSMDQITMCYVRGFADMNPQTTGVCISLNFTWSSSIFQLSCYINPQRHCFGSLSLRFQSQQAAVFTKNTPINMLYMIYSLQNSRQTKLATISAGCAMRWLCNMLAKTSK